MYQTAMELVTTQQNRQWVDILPDRIEEYNNHVKKKKKRKEATAVLGTGELLHIGMKVRRQLDNPMNIVDERTLIGKFRATDVRFYPHAQTITQILLEPGKPVTYLLSGNKKVAYTKNQLQIVRNDEQEPDASQLRIKKNQETFRAKEILDKKKEKNKIYYKVRWYGFTSANDTWELKSELIKSVPQLVNDYENR